MSFSTRSQGALGATKSFIWLRVQHNGHFVYFNAIQFCAMFIQSIVIIIARYICISREPAALPLCSNAFFHLKIVFRRELSTIVFEKLFLFWASCPLQIKCRFRGLWNVILTGSYRRREMKLISEREIACKWRIAILSEMRCEILFAIQKTSNGRLRWGIARHRKYTFHTRSKSKILREKLF